MGIWVHNHSSFTNEALPPDACLSGCWRNDARGAVVRFEAEFPAEMVEAIAARAAELVLERLPSSTPASEYLTVAETAELLRSEKHRVYDLLSSRRLTRFKDGTRVLVSRAEVVAYLSGCVAPALPRGSRSRSASGVAS